MFSENRDAGKMGKELRRDSVHRSGDGIHRRLRDGATLMVGPNSATMTLANQRNRQMFEDALKSVQENRLSLREYDANLLQNLEEGYRLAGTKMRITVKQFNYLRQLAWDFEKGA